MSSTHKFITKACPIPTLQSIEFHYIQDKSNKLNITFMTVEEADYCKTLKRGKQKSSCQILESKAMMVLRFMGFMYSLEPVIICSTINLLAFSDGWNGSQNA